MRRAALATKRFSGAVSSIINSQQAEFAAKLAVAANANEYANVGHIVYVFNLIGERLLSRNHLGQ